MIGQWGDTAQEFATRDLFGRRAHVSEVGFRFFHMMLYVIQGEVKHFPDRKLAQQRVRQPVGVELQFREFFETKVDFGNGEQQSFSEIFCLTVLNG